MKQAFIKQELLNKQLQIPKNSFRYSYAKTKIKVYEYAKTTYTKKSIGPINWHKYGKKKFSGQLPEDAQARSKQICFLQYRGFGLHEINLL